MKVIARGHPVGRVSLQGVTRQDAADGSGQSVGFGSADPTYRASSRTTLLALVAVFVLPFVIGSGLFWSGWRPGALRNHGELIQPPRTLPPSEALRGKWLLIVPAPDGCAQDCQDTLRRLQQAHAALGKDQGRVQRVLVSGENSVIPLPLQGGGRVGDGANSISGGPAKPPSSPHPHPNPPLEGEGVLPVVHSGLTIVSPAADAAAWRQALDGFPPAVFVADPFGNVMMRYGEPIDARNVLRDMERLLKYSWVR